MFATQDEAKVKSLRKSIGTHEFLMKEARSGRGIDRHLLGLWCAAYEADIDIPELYKDVLYTRRYSL